MLAVGALSPLTGFQGEADYHSVLDSMHLTNGLPWAIPVVAVGRRRGAGAPVWVAAAASRSLPAEGADAARRPPRQRDLQARQGEGSRLGLPHRRRRSTRA